MKQLISLLIISFCWCFSVVNAQSGTTIELGGSCFSPNPLIVPYHSMQNGKPAYFLPAGSVDGQSVSVVILWDPVTLGGIWALQFSGQTHYYNTSDTLNPNATNIDTWHHAMQSGAPSCLNSVTITGSGTIGNTLSLTTTNLGNAIKIYPNPSRGVFTLKYQGKDPLVEVTLTDILGTPIYKMPLNSAIETYRTIHTHELSSGVYFVKISSQTSSVLKRVVVE